MKWALALALALTGCHSPYYANGDRAGVHTRPGGDVVVGQLVPYEYGAGKRPQ